MRITFDWAAPPLHWLMAQCLSRFTRVNKTQSYFRRGWTLLGPAVEWHYFLWKSERLTDQMTHLFTSSPTGHFQCFLILACRNSGLHLLILDLRDFLNSAHFSVKKLSRSHSGNHTYRNSVPANKQVERLGTGTLIASPNLRQNVFFRFLHKTGEPIRDVIKTPRMWFDRNRTSLCARGKTRGNYYFLKPDKEETSQLLINNLIPLRTSLQKTVEDWHKWEVLTDVWLKMSKKSPSFPFFFIVTGLKNGEQMENNSSAKTSAMVNSDT